MHTPSLPMRRGSRSLSPLPPSPPPLPLLLRGRGRADGAWRMMRSIRRGVWAGLCGSIEAVGSRLMSIVMWYAPIGCRSGSCEAYCFVVLCPDVLCVVYSVVMRRRLPATLCCFISRHATALCSPPLFTTHWCLPYPSLSLTLTHSHTTDCCSAARLSRSLPLRPAVPHSTRRFPPGAAVCGRRRQRRSKSFKPLCAVLCCFVHFCDVM